MRETSGSSMMVPEPCPLEGFPVQSALGSGSIHRKWSLRICLSSLHKASWAGGSLHPAVGKQACVLGHPWSPLPFPGVRVNLKQWPLNREERCSLAQRWARELRGEHAGRADVRTAPCVCLHCWPEYDIPKGSAGTSEFPPTQQPQRVRPG